MRVDIRNTIELFFIVGCKSLQRYLHRNNHVGFNIFRKDEWNNKNKTKKRGDKLNTGQGLVEERRR